MTAIAIPLKAAAGMLGVGLSTLKRWIRQEGAPVVRRGRRGRGGACLVDPVVMAAWRTQRTSRAAVSSDALVLFVPQIPGVLARCFDEQLRQLDGPHKVATGVAFGQAYFPLVCALVAAARAHATGLPELSADMPHELARWFQPHCGK